MQQNVLIYQSRFVQNLSLSDLLNNEPMKDVFSSSFVCVDLSATLVTAVKEMRGVQGCQDVFVTETGDADGVVVGWLADRDLIEVDSRSYM